MEAALEHRYRYARASAFVRGDEGGRLALATSGGAVAYPYFFQGALRQPRQTARLLTVLSRVVAARFHMPPAMLRRIRLASDPIVTSGGGLLRFEAFSACCSTYARVDLEPDAYAGVVVGQGTTNVDFNPPLRAALAGVRDDEAVGLAIGADEVALLRGADAIVERKVELPLRWLKGLVETQACLSRMEPRAGLGRIETLRFLRSLPRSAPGGAAFGVAAAGAGLRLATPAAGTIATVAGIDRLRLLEELAPMAEGLRVHVDPRTGASNWELRFGPLRFALALSPEVWRGFSGEGQALEDLAAPTDHVLLERIRGALRWQAELRAEEFASNWDVPVASVRRALALLGSRGLVGYDLARGACFHRELPFDLTRVEALHPRLRDARTLAGAGGVTVLLDAAGIVEAEVRGSGGTIHRVRLSAAGDRCTCPWHAKHRGERGPCKHILAVRLATARPPASDPG